MVNMTVFDHVRCTLIFSMRDRRALQLGLVDG